VKNETIVEPSGRVV